MKAIIFGSDGFLGSNLAIELEGYGINILKANRSVLSFGDGKEFIKLEKLIKRFDPDLIINALGQIDSHKGATATSIFNSIFLPTLTIFDYFRATTTSKSVKILTFGSESEGKSRKNYPIYSALKTGEANLVATAAEYFVDTNVSWLRLKLPRLNGGLGLTSQQPGLFAEKGSIETVLAEIRVVLGIDGEVYG